MKRSLILSVVVGLCLGPIWIFSAYLLWVGHNAAGGGFIAGLVALAAVALQFMAFGRTPRAERLSRLGPAIAALGLAVASLTGAGSFLWGYPFLTSTLLQADVPLFGQLALSTATFFDIGVYAVVLGAGTTILSLFGDSRNE